MAPRAFERCIIVNYRLILDLAIRYCTVHDSTSTPGVSVTKVCSHHVLNNSGFYPHLLLPQVVVEYLIHLLKRFVGRLWNKEKGEDGCRETKARKEDISPKTDRYHHGRHRDTDTEIRQPYCRSCQSNTFRSLGVGEHFCWHAPG